jgi:hypothetical protein
MALGGVSWSGGGEGNKSLIVNKLTAGEELAGYSSKVLKKIPNGTNLILMKPGWYGIRYAGNRLYIAPIVEKSLHILERSGGMKELTGAEVETMVGSCKDYTEWALYQAMVTDMCRELVGEHALDAPVGKCMSPSSVKVKDETVLVPISGDIAVSVHAGERYVYRKLGITNTVKAAEYYKSHKGEIDIRVVEAFKGAELVYQVEEEKIQYWFDKDNTMFVASLGVSIPGMTTIITLYEEDFGWDAEQNRWLVESQIGKLKACKTKLDKVTADNLRAIQDNNQYIKELNDDIRLLEAKMEALSAQRATAESKNNELNSNIVLCREEYDRQFSKLFKKWEG